ncbi:Potassium channel subfamily K member 10 [Ameca splendens]|uniref:Potassium channel subfamily K member 10 n=1 Tax=Ameca splendens TaxID=208324 RepID=A0ABV1A0D3_9TELE
MVKSSLVHASVATMQNPMGYDPRTNGHCALPRLSISSRSASMVASLDASSDASIAALQSVMKWKTVMAVFIVVVLYLVAGALAFKALEQPFESNQKTSITLEKASFLERHPCVTPSELDAIIKTGFLCLTLSLKNPNQIGCFCHWRRIS